MYEAITTLLESIANHPWITLGIAILLFHLERGYKLVRYALIPHFKFTKLTYLHVHEVRKICVELYNLSQSDIQNKQSTKKTILSKNITLSLPLVELRLIVYGMGRHLLEKKLYDLTKEFLQKVELQYKCILLHEKCPPTLINPEELEQWVKDISKQVPRTFWESARAYFRINVYHFQGGKRFRPPSFTKDSFDSLFALGEAKKLKMFFLPRSDIPQQAKATAKNYIKAIEEAYRKKDEHYCVELFKSMNSFLEKNKEVLGAKEP